MRVNEECIALIKKFEGCRLKAYPDPATGAEPWTIGWGSTGPDIGPDTVWTQEKADYRLLKEIEKIASVVSSIIQTPCTENQFGALVSFAYNCGLGNLRKSTLLKLVNAGKFEAAAEEFIKWNKANGKVMEGLTRRRWAEKELFLSA